MIISSGETFFWNMKKELQDKAWEFVPREFREEIRSMLESDYYSQDQKWIFKLLFGVHNVTSSIEPPEVLMIPRKEVQTIYQDKIREKGHHKVTQQEKDMATGWINAMRFFFGREKCMKSPSLKIDCAEDLEEMFRDEFPGESQTPKFNKGERVVIKSASYDNLFDGAIATIKSVEKQACGFIYQFEENDKTFREEYLEPFCQKEDMEDLMRDDKVYIIDPENINEKGTPYTVTSVNGFGIKLDKLGRSWFKKSDLSKFPSEERELDLSIILRGHVGELFYSPACGKIRFVCLKGEYNDLQFQGLSPVMFTNHGYLFNPHDGSARCLLYPSLELYKKYPLDAYSAWMEWKEERG